MRQSLLYLFIYTFVLLLMFNSKVGESISDSEFILVAMWVAVSAAIVHIIHFWPSRAQ